MHWLYVLVRSAPQGGDWSLWAKAAAECRRFAAVHRCRFLEVQPFNPAGTESVLHLLTSNTPHNVDDVRSTNQTGKPEPSNTLDLLAVC